MELVLTHGDEIDVWDYRDCRMAPCSYKQLGATDSQTVRQSL